MHHSRFSKHPTAPRPSGTRAFVRSLQRREVEVLETTAFIGTPPPDAGVPRDGS